MEDYVYYSGMILRVYEGLGEIKDE